MHEDPPVARQDVEAVLEARRVLGPSFVLVATLVLAALLLGWRAVAARVARS